MPTLPGVPAAVAAALDRQRRDLEEIFGSRLLALVAHGPRLRGAEDHPELALNTLGLVSGLEYRDLVACGQKASSWLAAGMGVPLLLPRLEFERSLDAFPVEYGEMMAYHVLVAGTDPFANLTVPNEDLRRACERWGKSHLIQLREGFIESGGDARTVASIIVASAAQFAGLLRHIARLRGIAETGPEALAKVTEGIAGLPPAPVRAVLALEERPKLDGDTAMGLFPGYLDAVERLVDFLDTWSR